MNVTIENLYETCAFVTFLKLYLFPIQVNFNLTGGMGKKGEGMGGG